MKDKRFVWGIIATAAWLGVIVAALIVGNRPEKLNEWGDFCAGFFAPLALFWLVLGYLQQGDELKQNTRALELQLEELKQTVDVGRRQLEHAEGIVRQAREQQYRDAQPTITAQPHGGSSGAHGVSQDYRFTNDGGLALEILVEPIGTKLYLAPTTSRLAKGESLTLTLLYEQGDEGSVRFHYEDAYGRPGSFEASLTQFGERGWARIGKFEVIAPCRPPV